MMARGATRLEAAEAHGINEERVKGWERYVPVPLQHWRLSKSRLGATARSWLLECEGMRSLRTPQRLSPPGER